jgi:hypothetical protein
MTIFIDYNGCREHGHWIEEVIIEPALPQNESEQFTLDECEYKLVFLPNQQMWDRSCYKLAHTHHIFYVFTVSILWK